MKHVDDVWAKRFAAYMTEVQKYMRFIVSGHIGLVFVFVVGALGYRYSEWLAVAPKDFPVDWVVAVIVGVVVALSAPATLLKAPDQVYLLPLETQMRGYFKKALNWTFASQVMVPAILYIVAIPLINAVTDLQTMQVWFGFFVTLAMKYFHVQAEFYYRFANRGRFVWLDRFARIIISILILQSIVDGKLLVGALLLLILVGYSVALSKKAYVQPIPYEHFIALEEGRMLRFYRFANYFTDVPHLKGTVKRRSYLNFVYKLIQYKKANTQLYLVARTFIRVSDNYFLWIRLTLISAVVALFAGMPIVIGIVVAALSFASTLQLKQALLASHEFRMDMLYPVPANQRVEAVEKLLRVLYMLQAAVVTLLSIGQSHMMVVFVAIIAAGELTLQLSRNKK